MRAPLWPSPALDFEARDRAFLLYKQRGPVGHPIPIASYIEIVADPVMLWFISYPVVFARDQATIAYWRAEPVRLRALIALDSGGK